MHRGPRGCVRNECCTAGESVSAPCVNRPWGEIDRSYHFWSLRYDPTRSRTRPCWRVLNQLYHFTGSFPKKRIFLLDRMQCDKFIDNWRQVEAWIMLLVAKTKLFPDGLKQLFTMHDSCYFASSFFSKSVLIWGVNSCSVLGIDVAHTTGGWLLSMPFWKILSALLRIFLTTLW